jgi:hypothetical protein
VIARLSVHRFVRVARLGTVAGALFAALTLAVPAASVSAQEVKAIHENGMVVTPAQIGKSYFSTLSVQNHDTMQLQNGTLIEAWKITGSKNQCVQISMRSDHFDSFLELYSVDRVTGEMDLLERNDDGGEGLDARIEGRLPSSGTYYVVASAADGEDPNAKYNLDLKSC